MHEHGDKLLWPTTRLSNRGLYLQTLMTKAYRDKLGSSKPDVNSYASATIRVRLPEGLLLQGEFGAGLQLSSMLAALDQGIYEHNLSVKVYGGNEAGCRLDWCFQKCTRVTGTVSMQFCIVPR